MFERYLPGFHNTKYKKKKRVRKKKKPASMKTVVCPTCSSKVLSRKVICPTCGTYLRNNIPNEKKTRNEKIIQTIEDGHYTLREIGFIFGITRERVRQIYRKKTGETSYSKFYAYRREVTEEREKIEAERIVFTCKGCGHNVRKKEKKRGRFLCKTCREWCEKTHRLIYKWHTCQNCGTPFHPFRNSGDYESSPKGKFCSQLCYQNSKFFMGGIDGNSYLGSRSVGIKPSETSGNRLTR